MRAAVDSNVLIYAAGVNDVGRYKQSVDLLERLGMASGVIPAQALAECHRVLTRKYQRAAHAVAQDIARWGALFDVAPTTLVTLNMATAMATQHKLQIFDAVIIAAAAEAGCRVLFSEDMQHEAAFNGVTIINPFANERHPMVVALFKRQLGG
jgi:predicted nucleic acid-binding protein